MVEERKTDLGRLMFDVGWMLSNPNVPHYAEMVWRQLERLHPDGNGASSSSSTVEQFDLKGVVLDGTVSAETWARANELWASVTGYQKRRAEWYAWEEEQKKGGDG